MPSLMLGNNPIRGEAQIAAGAGNYQPLSDILTALSQMPPSDTGLLKKDPSTGLWLFDSNAHWDASNFPVIAGDGASFSPGILGGTVSGTPVYTTRLGTYWRIGSLVTVFVDLTISSIGGATGNLVITGLPIATKSGVNIAWVTCSGITGYNGYEITLGLNAGTTLTTLRRAGGTYVDITAVTSGAQLRFYGMYMAA